MSGHHIRLEHSCSSSVRKILKRKNRSRCQSKKISKGPDPALENLFGISLICEEIFKLLKPLDLKRCRLVNSLWQDVITNFLIRQDTFKINLIYYAHIPLHDGSFIPNFNRFGNVDGVEQWSLESLNKILKNSKNFPSTHFQLKGGNWGCDQIQSFLFLMGPMIRTLHLSTSRTTKSSIHSCLPEVPETSKEVFRQILTNQAVNVEKLILDISGPTFNWMESESTQFDLPNLKCLVKVLESSKTVGLNKTLKVILKAAQNLQLVENFSLRDTNLLVKTGRIKALKEFDWFIYNEKSLQNCQILSTHKPRLLILRFQWNNQLDLKTQHLLLESFLKVLVSSQNSLIELELTFMDFDFINIIKDFPTFENLKKLSLLYYLRPLDQLNNPKCAEYSFGSIFPQTNQTKKVSADKLFPKLETLSFRNMDWDKLFDTLNMVNNNFGSVKNVEIFNSWNLEKNIGCVWKLCPNFKRLVIGDREFNKIMPRIFNLWRHLESLDIRDDWLSTELPNWDLVFTGLSEKRYAKLLLKSSKKKSYRSKKIQRCGPWIGMLKGLRHLKISFPYFVPLECRQWVNDMDNVVAVGTDHDWSNFNKRGMFPNLTRISDLYAFKEMSNLQVIIHYNQMDIRVKIHICFTEITSIIVPPSSPVMTLVEF